MSPLPIIHPLRAYGEGPARGPKGECLCNHCRHWSPLLTHVRAQLDEAGQVLLDEYTMDNDNRDDELGCANSKLEGVWPGWECLKGFSPWTHKVVEMTEEEKAAIQAQTAEDEAP